MAKTILITGASSGIGKASAKRFQAEGWNVIATMRKPEQEQELSQLDNVLLARIDVTEPQSIADCVAQGIEHFGAIDVLLNNAGYGAYGVLEATPMEKIHRQFDTNVIGLFEVTKAVLGHMRSNGSGSIINVSSMGGKVAFPLGALYHGSKYAVEGLSEALYYELDAIGVRVKLVEPGLVNTNFAGSSFDFNNDESMSEYQGVVANLMQGFANSPTQPSEPEDIAQVIWTAATDGSSQLRYIAGADAEAIIAARKAQSDEEFMGGLKQQFGF
ncbi:SDR family oxidoreductase [Aliagarivorans marinus]|uniref:SDR family oxidoreductase n=1 Tax=Aliagarivorans marinus TaxID=561965 RepID=UPI000408D2CE|nr:SDR family oxidoreductase [Aliagarivorans marinus]